MNFVLIFCKKLWTSKTRSDTYPTLLCTGMLTLLPRVSTTSSGTGMQRSGPTLQEFFSERSRFPAPGKRKCSRLCQLRRRWVCVAPPGWKFWSCSPISGDEFHWALKRTKSETFRIYSLPEVDNPLIWCFTFSPLQKKCGTSVNISLTNFSIKRSIRVAY